MTDESGTVVAKNLSWHSKAIDEVMLNKVDNIRGFDFFERDNFCLL